MARVTNQTLFVDERRDSRVSAPGIVSGETSSNSCKSHSTTRVETSRVVTVVELSLLLSFASASCAVAAANSRERTMGVDDLPNGGVEDGRRGCFSLRRGQIDISNSRSAVGEFPTHPVFLWSRSIA